MVIHFVIYTMDIKEKNDMNKTYSIVRVSSVSQRDNTSLNNQKKVIKNYCEMKGLDLVECIEEVYTGTTDERDGLNYLMNKVKSGECDVVVVYKLDRLFRSFRSGINYINDLLELGVKIHSTQENLQTDTISGEFFMNVLLSLSQMEKQIISSRLSIGKEHRFLNDNKMVGSYPPFGYTKTDDEVLPSKDSRIVKYIFSLWNKYLHLTPYKRNKRILNLLTKRGWMFRNKPFQSYHLKMIIKNGFYKGDLSFGKNGTTKHNYPTIISSRMFNLCNGV